MANEQFDVIVVGGGMVGAALAARLAQVDIKVALVEARQPAPFDPAADYDLRVSALSGASQQFLQETGAWEYIEARRLCRYTDMRVWEDDASPELHFSALEMGRVSLGHIIENTLIIDALWQHLESVRCYCPAAIAGLDVAEAQATVTLEDGTSLQTALVVAADGGRSATRALAGIETFGWSYKQQGIVAVVKTATSHESTAWQRFLHTGPLAFLPLDDGRCSIVWSATESLAGELLELGDRAFCARLTEASQGRLGEVLSCGPRAAFPLQLSQAERYVQPRLVLVGDAAHVIHPLAGQGVNLGFGDAACLAELLTEAKKARRDLGGFKLLRRYERARKAEDALMARTTDALNRLYASDDRLLKLGRRQGVRAVNVLQPLKTALMRHAIGQ